MLNSKSQSSVMGDESVGVFEFPLVLVQGADRLVNASGDGGRDMSMGQPRCSLREPADRIGTTSGSSHVCVGSSTEMVLGQNNNPTGPVLTRIQPNEEEGNTRLSPVHFPCYGQDEEVDSHLLGQENVFPREVGDSMVEAVVFSNPEVECSGSKDKNRGVDSVLVSSQRADDEVPQSDLGIPCASTRLECFGP
ncbi:hypothetical protein V6N11_077226 [Hibiscus sabdariffa]|uniref:Uncharacterized protein n=1 Tax=Hibiscus sabdariffa TaxID=183260 RepID=A0ABR2TCK7_9ROSI